MIFQIIYDFIIYTQALFIFNFGVLIFIKYYLFVILYN